MMDKNKKRFAIVLFSVLCSGLLCAVGCDEDGADSVQTDSHALMTDSLGRELGEVSRQVVEANAEFEASMNLLARVELKENVMVEFYEPEPGVVIASGSGLQNADSSDSSMLTGKEESTADLWNSITRQAPMPEALKAAIDRQVKAALDNSRFNDMKVEPRHESSEPVFADQEMFTDSRMNGARGIGQYNMSCTTTYFQTPVSVWGIPSRPAMALGTCWAHPAYNDWCVCRDRLTGDSDSWSSSVENARGNICVLNGVVRYEVYDYLNLTWTVPQNVCRWWFTYGMSNVSIGAKVTYASGDRYNVRFEVEH